MTGFQLVIKYCAIALAIALIAAIIFGVVTAVLSLTFIFGEDHAGEVETYYIDDEINSLRVELAAGSFEVVEADALWVESNIKELEVNSSGSALELKFDEKVGFRSNKLFLKLYIPRDKSFDSATINLGAGKSVIRELSAENMTLGLGAGAVELYNIEAGESAVIKGGAGQIAAEGAKLNNASIDVSVGQLCFNGILNGECSIKSSVGAVALELCDSRANYSFDIKKGIGRVSVDGTDLSDGASIGGGETKVALSNSVGEIAVDFVK